MADEKKSDAEKELAAKQAAGTQPTTNPPRSVLGRQTTGQGTPTPSTGATRTGTATQRSTGTATEEAPTAEHFVVPGGLRYDLSELHSQITQGNVFSAFKRGVQLLHALLNPGATVGRAGRPTGAMRAPSRLVMPAQAREDQEEVDKYVGELNEFANMPSPEHAPLKDVTGGETSHALARQVTGEDLQNVVRMILRLIGLWRGRKEEEDTE